MVRKPTAVAIVSPSVTVVPAGNAVVAELADAAGGDVGAAADGDYLVLNLAFKKGDDEISSVKEETIRVRPVLSFRDGKIENFDKLMIGVKAGDKRMVIGDIRLMKKTGGKSGDWRAP